MRSCCTRAKTLSRSLTLQPHAEREAIQSARERHAGSAYAERYAGRAGIEGVVSQGVRAFGLRQARYRGLAKTHRQHVATVTAINVGRVIGWVNGIPRQRRAARGSPTSRRPRDAGGEFANGIFYRRDRSVRLNAQKLDETLDRFRLFIRG